MTIDRAPTTWGDTFLAFYMHNLTNPAEREMRDPFAQACRSADRVMERFEQLAERDRSEFRP